MMNGSNLSHSCPSSLPLQLAGVLPLVMAWRPCSSTALSCPAMRQPRCEAHAWCIDGNGMQQQ